MNKQRRGKKRGIGWTDYTWNPVSGCTFGCEWDMPDGSRAQCYAKTIAEGVAKAAYPSGFDKITFHPERLEEPCKVTTPSRIFVGSMSDLFGALSHAIRDVMRVAADCPQHQFQVLTKNPKRLWGVPGLEIPLNVWLGVSMPPTFMNGKRVDQSRYMEMAMDSLERFPDHITWLSLEPLSFDVAPYLYTPVIDWLVIGAASNGRTYFQPEPTHVQNVLDLADEKGIPVFMKSNLMWSPRRKEMPYRIWWE